VTPSSYARTSDAELRSPVPEHPHVQAAARLGTDPDAVRACLDEFDASLARRAQRRRAATQDLVAELSACDGVPPSPERIDAEARAACAQDRQGRLAAELRRLVTPRVAAVRRTRTLAGQELDSDRQAALNVLAPRPRPWRGSGPKPSSATRPSGRCWTASPPSRCSGRLAAGSFADAGGSATSWPRPERASRRRAPRQPGGGAAGRRPAPRGPACRLAGPARSQPEVWEALGAGAGRPRRERGGHDERRAAGRRPAHAPEAAR
jgi:hypothetical protein